MAVQHLSSIKGQFVHIGRAAKMVELSREVLPNGEYGAYVASRATAPVMIIKGDTQDEVLAEAFATIARFLDRMHSFGFRSAS